MQTGALVFRQTHRGCELAQVILEQKKIKKDCDAFQASKTTMFLTETVLVRVQQEEPKDLDKEEAKELYN